MAVIQALRQVPGAIVRTPGLVVPALVLFVLQAPLFVLQAMHPVLTSLVSMGATAFLLVFGPFYQGGMVGMADEALAGRSSLRSFVAHGKANFVQIFIAQLLVLVVNTIPAVLLVVFGFGGLLTFVFDGGTLVLVGLGLIAALLMVVYLLIVFVIQFFSQAIVLEERTAVDGLTRSYRVVRSNLLATVGYSVVAFGFGGVLGAIFGGLSLLTSPEVAGVFGLPELSTSGLIGVGVTAMFVGSVISAFLFVYSVSFYRLVSEYQGEGLA